MFKSNHPDFKKGGALIIFLLIACGPAREEGEKTNLSPRDFQSKLAADNVLIDVRSPEELESQYLAGAHNIDFRSSGFRNTLTTLDKDQTYLVYCASGVRSGKAADMMRGLGFEHVYTLEGGLRSWTEANLPAQLAKKVPSDFQIQSHGQSLTLVRGDASMAELTCTQAVGESCLAYSVSLVGDRGQAASSMIFYSKQEALDWVIGKLESG